MSRDLYFYENAGLFFLVEFNDENTRKKFDASLKLLGDNGIGADRTIGRGDFSFTYEEHSYFQKPTDNQYALLLSLYLPSEEEIKGGLLNKSWYNLKERKGYISHFLLKNLIRKPLTMLTEGSIISYQGRRQGIIVDVSSSPQMKIYRNGKAFFVGIKEFNNERIN